MSGVVNVGVVNVAQSTIIITIPIIMLTVLTCRCYAREGEMLEQILTHFCYSSSPYRHHPANHHHCHSAEDDHIAGRNKQIFGKVHFFCWVCSKAKGRCHKACTVAPFAMMMIVNMMTLMMMRIVNMSLIMMMRRRVGMKFVNIQVSRN